MRLVVTRLARADLDRIREYLNERNPAAAKKVAATFRSRLRLLKTQPNMGRPVRERPQVRELVVLVYVLVYRVLDDRIEVLRVWHGAQDRQL